MPAARTAQSVFRGTDEQPRLRVTGDARFANLQLHAPFSAPNRRTSPDGSNGDPPAQTDPGEGPLLGRCRSAFPVGDAVDVIDCFSVRNDVCQDPDMAMRAPAGPRRCAGRKSLSGSTAAP